MKMRMKRLAALTLVACMFASITACGSKEEAPKEEPAKEETVSVVSEVNIESVAGIESEDSKEETEVKETESTELAETDNADVESELTNAEKVLRDMLINDKKDGRTFDLDILTEYMGIDMNKDSEWVMQHGPEKVMVEVTYGRYCQDNDISLERFKEIYEEVCALSEEDL